MSVYKAYIFLVIMSLYIMFRSVLYDFIINFFIVLYINFLLFFSFTCKQLSSEIIIIIPNIELETFTIYRLSSITIISLIIKSIEVYIYRFFFDNFIDSFIITIISILISSVLENIKRKNKNEGFILSFFIIPLMIVTKNTGKYNLFFWFWIDILILFILFIWFIIFPIFNLRSFFTDGIPKNSYFNFKNILKVILITKMASALKEISTNIETSIEDVNPIEETYSLFEKLSNFIFENPIIRTAIGLLIFSGLGIGIFIIFKRYFRRTDLDDFTLPRSKSSSRDRTSSERDFLNHVSIADMISKRLEDISSHFKVRRKGSDDRTEEFFSPISQITSKDKSDISSISKIDIFSKVSEQNLHVVIDNTKQSLLRKVIQSGLRVKDIPKE